MKSATILIIFAALALLLYSTVYIVQESEQVVIVRFGKPIGEAVTEPGLHFKTPFVDEVRRFEKRWLEWDGDPNQITTRDKRYIFIDVFARWRIADPLVFIEAVRSLQAAHGRLDDIVDSAIRNVVANHNLIEAIRSTNREFEEADEEAMLTGKGSEHVALPVAPDNKEAADDSADAGPENEPAKGEEAMPGQQIEAQVAAPELPEQVKDPSLYAIEFGREKLTELIMKKSSEKAAELGIELKDVQFKRINYIESVQAKVYDRMISERQRVAEAFRSQGRGKSAEILGQTEKELREIRSKAYQESQSIMGKADAEAAAIYADAYQKDPEFYNFVKTLESYQKTIDDKTWLVLSTQADYPQILSTVRKAGP